jgi:hypothetical protein
MPATAIDSNAGMKIAVMCWLLVCVIKKNIRLGISFIGSAAQATDVQKLNDWQQYNYVDYVHQRLMSFSDLDIEQVFQLYDIRSPVSDPELCDATLVSDIRATCPIDEMARVAASASKSPVYRFQVCVGCMCWSAKSLINYLSLFSML